ncbi:Rne/Rng family ribonuclease [Enterobacteriaceae endosymbiont of Donacia bicoloricornis]|uniref:Rne/Rng family ribonuclease n=1 Tax=Enterobacteriaceae endosymbiont of Donacia bicoloricornis TaxID=2675772 RepID=UPI00144917A6|nr:Rne/Rng family ribonuclease [Enterobacteriaceae endosymbiont of Donacia bicoloricornis]QJC37617.1 Rne/Rng family ribonuclease [Enterobacteriaceae endosymbiont of Donacia bicoloricornis]
MKRMLINATQHEELRVALVDGHKLYDLDIENSNYQQKKSNIYKGKIIRIEPSLEAVFVDYGADKHGFLPIKEITEEYLFNFSSKILFNKLNLKNSSLIGKEIIVQIHKEERGNKGASLTTFISLAGSYLVLMPNNPGVNGISRKIEGENRKNLKKILPLLYLPSNMSLIIRTAGLGKNIETLKLDLKFRLKHWKMIKKIAENKSAPFLIYQESNIIIRALRDYLYQEINEILIDNPKILKLAKKHINILGRSDLIHKLKLYTGTVPLFSHYQIESQIETAFQRKVRLLSGGSIVIDTTEALTSVDVNSSKATKGIDIEETALNINLEAADEIIRQLRLRDVGGLIVIDFIDMSFLENKKAVEKRLLKNIRGDRAKIQINNISKFGLLEMSRQRLRSSLKESNYYLCPRCLGNGNLRDSKSLSLSILRLIEEESFKENTKEVYAIVPVKIASYLLNEKRNAVNAIENRNIRTFIIPNNKLNTPNYSILRIKHGEDKKNVYFIIKKIHKLNPNIYNYYYFKNKFLHKNILNKNNKVKILNIYDKNIIEKKKYSFIKENKLFNFLNRKNFFLKKIKKFFIQKVIFINKIILNIFNKYFLDNKKNNFNKNINNIFHKIKINKEKKIIPVSKLEFTKKVSKPIDLNNNLIFSKQKNYFNLKNFLKMKINKNYYFHKKKYIKSIINNKNVFIQNKKNNISNFSLENKIEFNKFKNSIKINKIILDKVKLHNKKKIMLKTTNIIVSDFINKHHTKIKNNSFITKKNMYKNYISSSEKKIQNNFTNCYNNKLINSSFNLNNKKGAGGHAAKRYATSPVKRP